MTKFILGRTLVCLMKLVVFQFIFLTLAFAEASEGQNLASLKDIKWNNYGNYTIKQIFSLIEDDFDLSFSYHSGDIGASLNSQIKLDSDVGTLFDVLHTLSQQENLTFKRINNTINVIKNENSKQSIIEEKLYPVKGKVVDESGNGLPGASIILKGTSIGTTADVQGDFTLEIPEGISTLVISYVGYHAAEVQVSKDDPPGTVSLAPDLQKLMEIVVVGYGEQKKETITGSVAKIESQEILQTKTPNVANSLVGRVPGLVINARGGQPGEENLEIFIRGKATTGDASPLYVIDGVANRGSFERLNPEDIESISVLKDASAAIYGAQAANGVILITTKRGKLGKPKFTYNYIFSMSQPARRPYLMDAVQYLTWIDETNLRNGRPQIYQNVIEDYQNGENDPEVWDNVDWWSETMDKWSPQHQHNLNISGGSESFKYFVSGQHLRQDAFYKGSAFGFQQNNIRSNIDITPTSFLEIGLDLAGRFEDREGAGSSEDLIRGIYAMAPFEGPYYSNGLLRKTSKGNIMPGIDGTNGSRQVSRQIFNNKIDVKLSFDKWVKGLSLIGFGAYDIINEDTRALSEPYDIYFLNEQGEYENLRDETGTINLWQEEEKNYSTTLHGRIDYKRSFGSHRVGAFVAYEQNEVNGEYIAASRLDLISADIPYLFSGSTESQLNDGRGLRTARVNYFGRLNYEFKDKYLAEFTLRHDGSQNFSEDKRFGTFPGLSVGWRISEEGFWTSGLVDQLKIRASWGKLGNDRVNDFQYLQLYDIVNGAVLGQDRILTQGLSPSTTPNPNITWETSTKTNLGVDMSLSDGLLDLTLDLFYEERSDILISRNASVPIYTGIQLPDENLGRTENKGVEISLLHRRNVSESFQYQVGGQFTYAKNSIVYMDESPFVPEYQRVEGSPIDYLLVYQADGLYQNQAEIDNSAHFPDAKPGDVRFRDVNNDGVIDDADRILLPEGPTPRFQYGFSLGCSWKGISLNAFFQGQGGASTIYRPWDINQDSWYFDNRWVSAEQTPNASVPAAWDMSSNSIQSVSTAWVRENDFLRIKNVELAYTLPNTLTRKFKVSNLRIFVSGFNLGFIYDNVKIYDPESRSDTGWYYPQDRTISTGISLSL